ncbi:hypothetical protein [Streptomyces sp. NBC_00582]|uniref:hypothetical protein n=1 Tax=Streptomyces sp. NBC_00582 TaxID=2975783 RepID=UPI002E80E686|nr:hypothetical protein [Streptomyces sp. NBC_00582]WUB61519.1 hypothetical protein OG852_14520 [Streptomyces sp. NBC_00582]
MSIAAPNPYSPYATADPYASHLFPTLFGPPEPGALLPTACFHLAVVRGQPPTEIDPATEQLPAGLCTVCVDHMRGRDIPESRPFTACQGCGADTRHNGMCAVCRAEAHELWQNVRTTHTPPLERQAIKPFIARGGPLAVTAGAWCEHGDFAFVARFRGYQVPDGPPQEITVILPRCYVAELLGCALAIIDHDSTPEALQRFADTITHAQDHLRGLLERRAAEREADDPGHGTQP